MSSYKSSDCYSRRSIDNEYKKTNASFMRAQEDYIQAQKMYFRKKKEHQRRALNHATSTANQYIDKYTYYSRAKLDTRKMTYQGIYDRWICSQLRDQYHHILGDYEDLKVTMKHDDEEGTCKIQFGPINKPSPKPRPPVVTIQTEFGASELGEWIASVAELWG